MAVFWVAFSGRISSGPPWMPPTPRLSYTPIAKKTFFTMTKWIYENDWGYAKKGSLHSIACSGYGFWGPPLQIGSQSEIVELTIKFSN
ncbi:hypothetical protein D0466_13600 [Peribacillus glennii]|uniref:Uncharacterized protein n=1 Tax=Peribacillus glennii TaxID=2303991 RepID=A0A372LB17_9BACI|nr:hypothetical protein D0466_13600 [Peribacillus glennii]